MGSTLIDLTGQTFGRLKVIRRAPNRGKQTYWACECNCGEHTLKEYRGGDLKNGHVKSCGCLKRENDIRLIAEYNHSCGNELHDMYDTRLYSIWTSMKKRCLNENCDRYKDYGERGIEICDEWKNSFKSFYSWAINNGYRDDLSIERKDNDEGYNPDNCTWIPLEYQARNTRNTVRLEINGELYTLHELSDATGIPYQIIRSRYYSGWDTQRILSQPVRGRK